MTQERTRLRSDDPVGYGGVDIPPLKPTEEWTTPPIQVADDGNTKTTDLAYQEVCDLLRYAIEDPYLTTGSFAYREAARARYAHRYSFALADPRAIEICVEAGPIVEVGAGSGWWAHLIQLAGGDIVATDELGNENPITGKRIPWTEVSAYDAADAAARWPERTLMMVWPPAGDMAVRALRAYSGDQLIYVGEAAGGSCGDDAFFAMLDSRWEVAESHQIPTWEGISDHLVVYQRKR